MNMGTLTTLVSDVALIGTSAYTGATITNDLVVGTIVAAIGVVIAIADVKYPEESDKVKQILKRLAEQNPPKNPAEDGP